jgi:hypothetical protein
MTPAAALSVAKQFHHAFELCRGNDVIALDGRLSPSIPVVVNIAFAIELALKATILSYGLVARGHELKVLFEGLNESDRTYIRSTSPAFDRERFDGGLCGVSKAFVEWRYSYEEPGFSSINLEFLLSLWDASSRLAEKKVLEQRDTLRSAKP